MTALNVLQPFREVTSLQERIYQIFHDFAPRSTRSNGRFWLRYRMLDRVKLR